MSFLTAVATKSYITLIVVVVLLYILVVNRIMYKKFPPKSDPAIPVMMGSPTSLKEDISP